MSESGQRLLSVIRGYGYDWSNLGVDENAIKKKLEGNPNYTPTEEVIQKVFEDISSNPRTPQNFSDVWGKIKSSDIYGAVDNSALQELKAQIELSRREQEDRRLAQERENAEREAREAREAADDYAKARAQAELEKAAKELEKKEAEDAKREFKRQQLVDEREREARAREAGLKETSLRALKGWETRRTARAFRAI